MNQQFKTAPATLTHSALTEKLGEAARFIRCHSVASIFHAGSGHPGGALSSADLFACLYGAEMNVWPAAANDPARDRFVLSKGHAAPALYATGAHFGFCDPKAALTLRKLNSPFQGHPHVLDLPWVETSTGSLGQGISVAIGMAVGLRLQKIPARVYTMLGDGELQEGEVWEAAMSAAHHRLDNLCAVIDYNKLQSDNCNDAIMRLEPLADKWRAFGWSVREVDGHNHAALLSTFKSLPFESGKPSCVIAHTHKGQGVSFIRDRVEWHHHHRVLTDEELAAALQELGEVAHEPVL